MTAPAPTVETHLIGLPGTDLIHAVPESHIMEGNWAAHGPMAPARCGQWVRVAPVERFGVFNHGDPENWSHSAGGACPTCAWEVALDAGTWDTEIDVLTPAGAERDAHVALGADPDLVPRLCRAAIDATVRDTGYPPENEAGLVLLLAQITAHRPMLTYTVGDDDDGSGERDTPAGLVCTADSLTVMGSCGEDHFIQECVVPAPCDVLRTVAKSLGVVIGRG